MNLWMQVKKAGETNQHWEMFSQPGILACKHPTVIEYGFNMVQLKEIAQASNDDGVLVNMHKLNVDLRYPVNLARQRDWTHKEYQITVPEYTDRDTTQERMRHVNSRQIDRYFITPGGANLKGTSAIIT